MSLICCATDDTCASFGIVLYVPRLCRVGRREEVEEGRRKSIPEQTIPRERDRSNNDNNNLGEFGAFIFKRTRRAPLPLRALAPRDALVRPGNFVSRFLLSDAQINAIIPCAVIPGAGAVYPVGRALSFLHYPDVGATRLCGSLSRVRARPQFRTN